MAKVLESRWGKLFSNWEHVTPDARGYESVGEDAAVIERTGFKAFLTSLKILVTCILEAPEVAARRRTKSLRNS
jgi:hypothetical protein